MISIPIIMALVGTTIAILIFGGAFISRQLADKYHQTFTSNASTKLSDMFMFIEPKKLFRGNLIAMTIMFLLTWAYTGNWFIALLIFTFMLFSPPYIYKYLQEKRRKKFIQQLPDSLNMICASMRAGSSLINAIEAMVEENASGPIGQEFTLFLREQRLGIDFIDGLNNMVERIPDDDFKLVVSGMQISKEIGGNLAETLERLSETLRRKLEMEGKINSLTSQGRAQGIVMSLLPIFLGFVLYQMEPEHMSRLFTEPVGWIVLGTGSVMIYLGYFIIKKIVSIDV